MFVSQRFPEGVGVVRYMFSESKGEGRGGFGVVFLGGFPPGGDGRFDRRFGGERRNEVGDDGFL
ncbi:hypothetical protein HanIR_Chr02g0074071 [Helianthus annuus]|nr:hypothetical protein HanIR_Chr02g0074071 [Helianthus annuus]